MFATSYSLLKNNSFIRNDVFVKQYNYETNEDRIVPVNATTKISYLFTASIVNIFFLPFTFIEDIEKLEIYLRGRTPEYYGFKKRDDFVFSSYGEIICYLDR